MKKIVIGRNNACDIIIQDTTDHVSRKQAVLAISFLGKMLLYDTSNNGTYVNGQRIESGKPTRVTRKDKVNFAQTADLDWNEVKDPYRKTKIQVLIGSLLLALVVAGLVWLILHQRASRDQDNVPAQTEVLAPARGETVTTVDTPSAPEPVVSKQTKLHPKASPVRKNRGVKRNPNEDKEKESPGKKMLDRNSNDNTPIVY